MLAAAAPLLLTLALGAAPAPPLTLPPDDPKPPPEKPLVDPDILSGELAFVGVGAALLGGGSLALAFADSPASEADRQRVLVFEVGGISLLATAGLIGASSVALAAFDPSTGAFKLKTLFEGSD